MNPGNPNHSGPREIWWKQPWPWIILGMLGSVVVASLVTVYIAATTQDSLVVADYTKAGKTINLRLEKDRLAERLGIQVQLSAEAGPDGITLLTARYKAADPAAGVPKFMRLNLSHPTLANLDLTIALISRGPSEYRAQVSDLQPAHWHYTIEDPDAKWRVKGRVEN